jgi:SAM-dependent methyltransferase
MHIARGTLQEGCVAPTSYGECPGRSARCDFSAGAALTLETGNSHAPTISIHRCLTCGHGVTRPAMPDVAPLYTDRQSDDYLARDSAWLQRIKGFFFAQTARYILSAAKAPSDATILDFGTGNGMLASAFAKVAGENSKVIGLDFFEYPPESIGRADYSSFTSTEGFQGSADLLTCFHVLEHDDNPHTMLGRLTSFLKPGGVLVIEVPNVDCVWNTWFGRHCANWYAPFHRLHFSRQSLRTLIETHGLDIIEERDICGATIAMSLADALGVRPGTAIFLAAIAFRPIQWLAEKLTRRPTALRLIARRP